MAKKNKGIVKQKKGEDFVSALVKASNMRAKKRTKKQREFELRLQKNSPTLIGLTPKQTKFARNRRV